MKKTITALAACAVVALAPVSSALAETVAAKDADAVAKAWVPATKAEQQNARGGGGGNYLFYSLQNTFCNNVTISTFFCRRKEV